MTTQAPQKVIRELTNKVLSVGRNEKDTAWMITLPAEGNSKYPLAIYTKNDDMVKGLSAGQFVTLVLERGNLKSGKSGQYQSDYYENLLEVRPATAAAAPPPQARPTAPPPQQGGYADPRQASIERQVCFKAAVDLVAALVSNVADLNDAADLVEMLTNRFAASVFHHDLTPAGPEPETSPPIANDGSDAPLATYDQLKALTEVCNAKGVNIAAQLIPFVKAKYGVEGVRQLTGRQCKALSDSILIIGPDAVKMSDVKPDDFPF